jgi:hypothetical protein
MFKLLISNFTLYNQNNKLYINNQVVAPSVKGDNAIIIIQDVTGSDGLGSSFTIGISVGRKFLGLCYDLEKVDAIKIANYLSFNLGLSIEKREAAAFPLFKLH